MNEAANIRPLNDNVDSWGLIAEGPAPGPFGEQKRDGGDTIHRVSMVEVLARLCLEMISVYDRTVWTEPAMWAAWANTWFSDKALPLLMHSVSGCLRRHPDERYWYGDPRVHCWERLSRDAYQHFLAACAIGGHFKPALKAIKRKREKAGLFFDYHWWSNGAVPKDDPRYNDQAKPYEKKPGSLTVFDTWALELRCFDDKELSRVKRIGYRVWREICDIHIAIDSLIWRFLRDKENHDINSQFMCTLASYFRKRTFVSWINFHILFPWGRAVRDFDAYYNHSPQSVSDMAKIIRGLAKALGKIK
jgi:hypothetical protein